MPFGQGCPRPFGVGVIGPFLSAHGLIRHLGSIFAELDAFEVGGLVAELMTGTTRGQMIEIVSSSWQGALFSRDLQQPKDPWWRGYTGAMVTTCG